MSRVRRALLRVRTVIRQDGWVALWFGVLGELGYRRILLLEKPLDPSTFVPDARCRPLTPDGVPDLLAAQPELTEHVVRQRLQAGHRCYLIRGAGGTVVTTLWVAFGEGRIGYLGLTFPLAPGDAYYYNTHTVAEARGQGLFTSLANAVDAELYAEGVRRIVSGIMPNNRLAYAPMYRRGFTPTGYLGRVRVGGRRWVFERPARGFPWYAPPRRPGP